MAENYQDKTETPTPRRRQEARSRGQVGKSPDLAPALILMAAMLLLHFSGQSILAKLLKVTRTCLSDPSAPDATSMLPLLKAAFRDTAGMVLPLLVLVFAVALIGCFAQVGLLFTTQTLKPSLDKLNPVTGLQRMFGARAFVQLLMGLAKMCLLGVVTWLTLRSRIDVLANASHMPHLTMVGMAAELVYTLGLRLAIVLLLLALIDFIYQRYKTERDLRMTKEEVKEEMRRMDGDPMVKKRRREVQMQLSLQRMKAAVPKADVVITNPTELAVAIQYDTERMDAPRVIAKGADEMARRIREIAIEHGIPIVERKPLARALYKSVEVGREIPVEFYRAVAEVLAYVYELSGRSTRRPMATSMN